MTNSTPEWFGVDGVSLQTFAYNIESWGGSREAPPAVRGTNITIPGMPGKLYVPKVADSRTITLAMWVIGANEDGSRPTSGSRREEFEHNFKMLRRLLWTPGRQVTLTKRFYEYGSSVLTTVTGKAEFSGGLDISMQGNGRGVFTVDLHMADPYFYSPYRTVPVFQSVNQAKTFTVDGDARTNNIKITMAGARTNPRFTTVARGESIWSRYNGVLGATDSATIDVREFASSTKLGAAAAYNSSGLMTHGGDPFWMAFEPGQNTINLASLAGTGDINIEYQEAWL